MVSKPAIVGVLGGVTILAALGLNFWLVPGDDDAAEPRVEAVAVPAKPKVPDTASAAPSDAAVTPEASTTEPSQPPAERAADPAERRPSFDIVRVDPDGNAVIAGRARPNAEVTIMDGDRELGSVTSDDRGEWVFLPDHPLGAGQFALTLRQDGAPDTAESEEAVVLVVPEIGKDIAGRDTDEPSQPLAMVMPRDEAAPGGARILQAPAAGPAQSMAPAATAEPTVPAATADTDATPTETADAVATPSTDRAPEPTRQAQSAAADVGGAAAASPTTPDPASASSQQATGGADASAVASSDRAASSPAASSSASSQPAPGSDGAKLPETVAVAPDRSAPAAAQADAAGQAAPAAGDAAAPASQVAALPDSAARDSEPATSGSTAPAPPAASDDGSAAPTIQAFPQPAAAPSAADQAPPGQVAQSGDVSVDVIEYDDKGEVVFGGRTEPNADVEVYIDNKPAGSATADAEGRWQLRPEKPVEPGNYNLRVDKVTPGGTVKARVAFPFVRAAPLKGLPNDRLVVIQPGNNLWLIATRVYGQGLRYVEIHDANRDQIQNPDLIYPGQVFGLPTVN